MNFSYLDKEEYKDIKICDSDFMLEFSNNDKFYIRKYLRDTSGHSLHRHKYIQINYVSSGKGYHIINNRKVEISKGDIFVIPPYVPHVILPGDDTSVEIYEFEFNTEFVLSDRDMENYGNCLDFAYLEPFMVSEEKVKAKLKLDEKTRRITEELLNEALDEYNTKSSGYILIAKAVLLKLLVVVGRAYSEEIKGTDTEIILNRYKDAVYRAVEYIEDNYSENITLKDTAANTNYSQSHFSYLFKAITGKTFGEYLSFVRINKAVEFIEKTDMSITEISLKSGFNTVSNFNKTFKALTGTTPREYRTTLKEITKSS